MAGEDHPDVETTRADGAESLPAVDVVLEPAAGESSTPWGLIAGAGALVLALGVGAYSVSNGESEVDVAQSDPAESSEETPNGDGGDDTSVDGELPEDELIFEFGDDSADEEAFEDEEAMMDMAVGVAEASTSTTVFDGERFASLTNVGNSWALRTSTDGLTWSDAPVTGLDGNGYIHSMGFEDGTFVAVLDSFDESTGSRSSFVVSSTDGVEWTSAALPTSGEDSEAATSGLALNGERVVLIQTRYSNGPDPVRILVDAGVLSESQAEMFCGLDMGGANDAITVQVCDYDEEENFEGPSEEEIDALAARFDAATSDEEREQIEKELEQLWGGPGFEVVATIEPNTPLHEQLSVAYEGGDASMTASVLAGPLSGPFTEVSTLPSDRHYGGLVQSGSALFMSAESYDEDEGGRVAILTSVDGSTWDEVSGPPVDGGGQLQALGDALFFMGYGNEGGSESYVSTDGGQTWTASSLETDLFGPYTQFLAGDAGIVAFTQGSLTPFPEVPAFEPPNVVVDKDGYTLEISLQDATFTFSSADGVVIYELSEEEMFDGFDGLRENPISGDLTFLDPETGEDLVTFTEDDWGAAHEESFAEFEENAFVEPERGSELHFSTDGTSWTELDNADLSSISINTSVQPLVVGDDEAIFALMSYDPPAELLAFQNEGREPTDAEIEAIERWENDGNRTDYVRIELG